MSNGATTAGSRLSAGSALWKPSWTSSDSVTFRMSERTITDRTPNGSMARKPSWTACATALTTASRVPGASARQRGRASLPDLRSETVVDRARQGVLQVDAEPPAGSYSTTTRERSGRPIRRAHVTQAVPVVVPRPAGVRGSAGRRDHGHWSPSPPSDGDSYRHRQTRPPRWHRHSPRPATTTHLTTRSPATIITRRRSHPDQWSHSHWQIGGLINLADP